MSRNYAITNYEVLPTLLLDVVDLPTFFHCILTIPLPS